MQKKSEYVATFALLFLISPGFLLADDDPAKPAEDAAPKTASFEELFKQWNETDKAFDSIITKFRTTTDEEKPALRKEYDALVVKAKALLGELRVAAAAAYKAAPNKDKRVSDVLLSLVANDLHKDQYESAMELAKLLLDNNCESKALPGVVGQVAYNVGDFDLAAEMFKKGDEAGTLNIRTKRLYEDVATAKKLWAEEQAIRKKEAEADDLPRVKIETAKGDIIVELFENEAPDTVGNFISLVEKKFYDGLSFHRVLPGFMAQVGCPLGDGTGDAGYKIYCECHQEPHRKHFRGSLSMAKGQPRDTGGSQFFLCFNRTYHLDGEHTVFGRVIEGLDVLAKIQRRDPASPTAAEPERIKTATVVRKRDHEYKPNKVE